MQDEDAAFLERLENDDRWDTGELGRSEEHTRSAGNPDLGIKRLILGLDEPLQVRLEKYARELGLTPIATIRFLLRSYLPK